MKNLFLLIGLLLIGFVFSSNYPVYNAEDAPIRKEFSVLEGQALSFDIASFDPDGDIVIIDIVSVLPEGMVVGETIFRENFSDSSLPEVTFDSTPSWYTKSVEWTPNYKQQGEYIIEIKATDEFGAENWVKYKITVINVNRPPVL